MLSLGCSDNLLELLAESSMGSSVFWAGVVDSPLVKLVLFLDLSFDFWVALHHPFLRGFGFRSWVSMTRWMTLRKCCDVVAVGGVRLIVSVTAVVISRVIVVLCFS